MAPGVAPPSARSDRQSVDELEQDAGVGVDRLQALARLPCCLVGMYPGDVRAEPLP